MTYVCQLLDITDKYHDSPTIQTELFESQLDSHNRCNRTMLLIIYLVIFFFVFLLYFLCVIGYADYMEKWKEKNGKKLFVNFFFLYYYYCLSILHLQEKLLFGP